MKPEKAYVIGVMFDSSHKIYKYKISETAWHKLHKDDRIHICNDKGYDYRNAVVTVVDFDIIENPSCELREIVAFRREGSKNEIKCDNAYDYDRKSFDQLYNTVLGEMSIEAVNKIASAAEQASCNFEEMTIAFNSINEEKENNSMNKMFGNIEFGKYTGSFLRPSWKGMAYRSGDAYVCWDKDANDLVDVTNFTIPNTDFIYLMPVAISDVKVGDVIKHNGEFVIATAAEGSAGIKVIAPQSREVKTILPMKNVFGFDFVTKVVSFIDLNLLGTPNSDNPFGNMGMLLALSGDRVDTNTIMMISMMQGGKMDMSNPMMMYFMLKDGNNDMLLPLMLMQNGGFGNIWSGRKNCDESCDCDCHNVKAQ